MKMFVVAFLVDPITSGIRNETDARQFDGLAAAAPFGEAVHLS